MVDLLTCILCRINIGHSLLLIAALFYRWKKSYWRHFDRGLMSKEALHQLIDWADTAADHTKKWVPC